MSELNSIAQSLCHSIDTIMNVNSTQTDRNNANVMIEHFKNSSEPVFAIRVSLLIINSTESSRASKHHALQLLEHIIKYHWNSMDIIIKNEIKQLIELWVMSDDNSLLMSRHLLHAASRCITEMMSREWPQSWPKFFSMILSKRKSPLSLFIIWRVTEDIGVFFLPYNGQRRREMNCELMNNINDIYGYICECLTCGDVQLCQIAVMALSGVLEWGPFNAEVLKLLCQIIDSNIHSVSNEFNCIKVSSCDCLLICVNRKSLKPNDKSVIQSLFNDTNMHHILKFSREKLSETNCDAQSFTLQKRLMLVLLGLGSHICDISSINVSDENYLYLYIKMMVSMLSHENLILNEIAVQFWLCLLRQHSENFNSQHPLSSIITNLIMIIPNKLIRREYSKSQLGFEFDSADEYELFFFKFRSEMLDLMRQLTVINESLCFKFVCEKLRLVTNSVNQNEWEIVSQLLAAVCNKLTNLTEHTNLAFQHLYALINDDDILRDVNIISSQLSCISALTIFIPFYSNNDLLSAVIRLVFANAVYTIPGQTKSSRTKDVKNLRRHACSFFIKLSQTFPHILIPLFSDLKSHIDLLSSNSEELSQMEKCALNEGLILISNEFSNIESQQQFIEQLLVPIQWIINFNLTTEQFMSYIGIDDIDKDNAQFGKNRADILYAINIMLGLLKRVNRKICFSNLLPLIHSIFPIINHLNQMWRNEYQEKCHCDYRPLAYANMTEADRTHLLEIPIMSNNFNGEKSLAQRMQTYIWTLHENCYSLIGIALSVLSPDIYISDFTNILNDLQYLPLMKLRMILKSFVRSLVMNCPNNTSQYEKTLLPILNNYLLFMFNKINDKWDEIKLKNNDESEDMRNYSENVENELIDDKLNRLLSREFIDFLASLILPNRTELLVETEESMRDVTEGDHHLSDLGNFLLQTIPNTIILTTFKSLLWLDSIASLKSANLSLVIIHKIINDNMINNDNGADFLFDQILKALSYFGEHEQNQTVLLQLVLVLYEGIVQKLGYESIKSKLSDYCGCNIQEWHDFDKKWTNQTKHNSLDKRKRDSLKKILVNVIGKNIGQLYKHNKVYIKNLQPLFVGNRKKSNDITFEEDISLCLLFDSN